MRNNKNILEVKNLNKSYGKEQILEDFSFQLKKNEIVSIIGPSGAGKSTFLRTLNSLEPVESGVLTFDYKEYDLSKINNHEKTEIRKKMNMVFQHYNLFNNKTVIQNITEALIIVHKYNLKAANKKAMEVLELVDLEEKAHQYPHQLSGGQKQRIGIARALATDPKVILFDEPTSALDPELIGEVVEIIKKTTARQSTMIIVTHEMSLAREISDRILFMDHGHIVAEGSPDDLFIHSENKRLRQFLARLS